MNLNTGVCGNSKLDTVKITTSWKRYTRIYNTESLNGSLTIYANSTSAWYITDIKLEVGNKATDWTPAPLS